MDSNLIREELYSKGFNQSILAEVIGCSPSLVNKVINRRAVSLRVADAIAKAIELPRLKVFPEMGDRKLIVEDRSEKLKRLRELLG